MKSMPRQGSEANFKTENGFDINMKSKIYEEYATFIQSNVAIME